MTASCESPVRTYERFTVTYTLLNNLQDFLAVRLVWTPEHAQSGRFTRPGPGPQVRDREERRVSGSHLDQAVGLGDQQSRSEFILPFLCDLEKVT